MIVAHLLFAAFLSPAHCTGCGVGGRSCFDHSRKAAPNLVATTKRKPQLRYCKNLNAKINRIEIVARSAAEYHSTSHAANIRVVGATFGKDYVCMCVRHLFLLHFAAHLLFLKFCKRPRCRSARSLRRFTYILTYLVVRCVCVFVQEEKKINNWKALKWLCRHLLWYPSFFFPSLWFGAVRCLMFWSLMLLEIYRSAALIMSVDGAMSMVTLVLLMWIAATTRLLALYICMYVCKCSCMNICLCLLM